jgi:hypothetical protein
MRGGVCHLIHSLSISKIRLNNEIKFFIQTLIENLKHPNPEI